MIYLAVALVEEESVLETSLLPPLLGQVALVESIDFTFD